MTPPPRPEPTTAPTEVAADATAGLPILAEVPALAAVLDVARRIDRLVAELIGGLMDLLAHDVAEHATGVALEQWLAIVGRRTGADRRMLLTTCEVLGRLPTLRHAFLDNATISWAQTRAVVLKVCRLPRHLDEAIDTALGPVVRGAAGADPDALGHAVTWALNGLDPTPPGPSVAPTTQFFAMQPRLDGTGGRVWGEFDALGFATLDAALELPATTGRRTRTSFGADPHPESARSVARAAGAARATRLLELLEGHVATPTDPPAPRATARPHLLVRLDLATLLDRDQLPAQLLTTLTGGRMWARATTIRDLVEARGAELRTIVLDDTGATVGVGRRTRIPPGWLTEATLALHDTCTAPGCQTAARRCHTDHAAPWHPTGPDRTPGHTDLDNLAPLCATHNHSKEPAGWTTAQDPNGARTWHHPRTGLTTRTLPATWRPPPTRPPPSDDLGTRPDHRSPPDPHVPF
jgi:hypothetical protein